MVLEFLLERIGREREAAHVHSHREVRAFNVARIDMLAIGVASNYAALRTKARLAGDIAVRLPLACRTFSLRHYPRDALFHDPRLMRVKVLSVRVVAGPMRLRERRGQAHGQTSDRSGGP